MLRCSLSKLQAACERKLSARPHIVLQAANVRRRMAAPKQVGVQVEFDGVDGGQAERCAGQRRTGSAESKEDVGRLTILVGKRLHLRRRRRSPGV
jgi:hypothetical protein